MTKASAIGLARASASGEHRLDPASTGGSFEATGIRTTVPLLVGFLVVCGLEVITGWQLWRGGETELVPAYTEVDLAML